jgi:hypothetical protein
VTVLADYAAVRSFHKAGRIPIYAPAECHVAAIKAVVNLGAGSQSLTGAESQGQRSVSLRLIVCVSSSGALFSAVVRQLEMPKPPTVYEGRAGSVTLHNN